MVSKTRLVNYFHSHIAHYQLLERVKFSYLIISSPHKLYAIYIIGYIYYNVNYYQKETVSVVKHYNVLGYMMFLRSYCNHQCQPHHTSVAVYYIASDINTSDSIN